MSLTTDTASQRGSNPGAITPVRKTRRSIAKEQTAQKVLAAAEALFVEEGFEATTIRGIAKRVGMSTGAIFASYEDKAHLLAAVLDDNLASLREHLANVRMRESGTRIDHIEDAFQVEYEPGNLPIALLRERSAGFPDSKDVLARHILRHQEALFHFVLGQLDGFVVRNPTGEFDLGLTASLIVAAHHANLRKMLVDDRFTNPQIRLAAMIELMLR